MDIFILMVSENQKHFSAERIKCTKTIRENYSPHRSSHRYVTERTPPHPQTD